MKHLYFGLMLIFGYAVDSIGHKQASCRWFKIVSCDFYQLTYSIENLFHPLVWLTKINLCGDVDHTWYHIAFLDSQY